MANRVKEDKYLQDSFVKHRTSLDKQMVLKMGEGIINQGQALELDSVTGKLIKLATAGSAYTIFTGDTADSTAADVNITVLQPGACAIVDKSKVIGIGATAYSDIQSLEGYGIILETVTQIAYGRGYKCLIF